MIWLTAAVTAGLAAVAVLVAARSMIQNRSIQLAMQGAIAVGQETQFDNAGYQVLPSHGPNVRILLIGTLPAPTACIRESKNRNRSKAPACPPLTG
jgi:hypothetical protein